MNERKVIRLFISNLIPFADQRGMFLSEKKGIDNQSQYITGEIDRKEIYEHQQQWCFRFVTSGK